MPKISLIIPFYNAENYIYRLIENLKQAAVGVDESELEIIFVDDWGSDSSRKILESITDIKFKIVDCGENQGLGGARNLGVESSSGEWIMFLDHDDLLCENAINVILEKIKHNQNLNFIRFNYIERFLNEEIKHNFSSEFNKKNPLFPVMQWSKVIKKELYVQSQKHVKHEDNLWTFDFIKNKMHLKIKYGFIDEYIYIYDRTNENSITTQVYPDDMQVVYLKLIEVLKTCDKEIKTPLIAFYLYSIKYSIVTLKKWGPTRILLGYTLQLNIVEYKDAFKYIMESRKNEK